MKAKQIYNLRKKLRLTQKEMGGRIGVDAITISRWERGIQKPKVIYLQSMARLERRIK